MILAGTQYFCEYYIDACCFTDSATSYQKAFASTEDTYVLSKFSIYFILLTKIQWLPTLPNLVGAHTL